MLTTIKVGLGAVSLVAILGGCGAAPRSHVSEKSSSVSGKADGASAVDPMFACATDSDCVAIEDDSQCPDGVLVAVNVSYADAYCGSSDQQDCSVAAATDTRVAQCDFQAHACHLIAPADIVCGSFIAPPLQHQCPAGYQCNLLGRGLPDAGGKCEPATTGN